MGCEGKTGQALKDCEKKSKVYKASEGTVADLNAANFKNKDVMKWSTPKKRVAKSGGSDPIRGLGQLGQTTRIARQGTKRNKK